jgi:Na+-translocating ferredoxin:NAD+ oxidoreductase subunit E
MSGPAIQAPGLSSLGEFMEGVWKINPIFVMVLGMCPAMAITTTTINSLSMGLATTFVLAASCLLVSLIRKIVPNQVRIATYIVIIATFVTVVDYEIKAISLALSEALGVYVALIVANCLVLARAESHAAKRPPLAATLNAIGMGLGFTLGLVMIGSLREVFGYGTFFEIPLFGANYQPWVVMILPPGGFISMGLWCFAISAWRRRKARKAAEEDRAAQMLEA